MDLVRKIAEKELNILLHKRTEEGGEFERHQQIGGDYTQAVAQVYRKILFIEYVFIFIGNEIVKRTMMTL